MEVIIKNVILLNMEIQKIILNLLSLIGLKRNLKQDILILLAIGIKTDIGVAILLLTLNLRLSVRNSHD